MSHRVRRHLDVQNAVVGDERAVEAKCAPAGETAADLARPQDLYIRVGQRIPSLPHTKQPAMRDEDAHGFIVERHSS